MADLGKIKRNVGRMVQQNAPETDIDAYIASEGVTLDAVRAHKAKGPSPEAVAVVDKLEKAGDTAGMTMRLADSATFGAMNPAMAAVTATAKTGYKALTGGTPDWQKDYELERDISDERLRRARERGGAAGHAAEFALTLPLMPISKAGQAAEAVRAAPGMIRQGIDAAKTGALYSGIYGFNSARGGVGEHLENTAEHSVGGALLGPVFHAGVNALARIPNALNTAQRYLTGRSPENVAAVSGNMAENASAGVRDFGPAVSENRLMNFAARGLANRPFVGQSLRQGAQRSIADVEAQTQGLLSRETGGIPANDIGAEVQGTLKNALVERRPRAEIERMDDAALAGFGGMQPRPIAEPVQPRPVETIQPEPVDPRRLGYKVVEPQPVEREPARMTYSKESDIPHDPAHVAAHDASINAYQMAKKDLETAEKAFTDAAQAAGVAPEKYWSILASREATSPRYSFGEFRPATQPERFKEPLIQNVLDARSRLKAASEETNRTYDQAMASQRAAWKRYTEGDFAEAQKMAEREYQQKVDKARAQAEAETAANREEAIRTATAENQRRAEQQTLERRAQANREAIQQTEEAQAALDRAYAEEGPRVARGALGKTRESYPTELDAQYEMVLRNTPDFRSNPLGGPTPEGRAAKTSTKNLIADLADEARLRLKLQGEHLTESGEFTPEFASYLSGRLGPDIAQRLTALAAAKPGTNATTARGIRDLRTSIRRAAEEAERPSDYSRPRSEDAAALRRLEGALSDDLHRFVREAPSVPRQFMTETGPGEFVDRSVLPGSTKIGDRSPSDQTIFVKPEHLERLTGSQMPNDHAGSLPATHSYRVDGNVIVMRRNDKGADDKGTRVPFSRVPEPGLRPVQLFADGAKVHYGSPVISRGPTQGELAAADMAAADANTKAFYTELRRPLAKLFGEKTSPLDAMNHLQKAAESGDLSVIRPYMRVMTEKADPTRGAAAIVSHMTQGAENLSAFLKGYRSIRPEVKEVLFSSPGGRALQEQLDKLARIGTRLEPYAASIERNADTSGLRAGHIPLGALFYFHFAPTITAYAGGAALGKFMSSPAYVRWLTRAAELKSPGEWTKHLSHLTPIVERDTEYGADIRRGVGKLMEQVNPVGKPVPPGMMKLGGPKPDGFDAAPDGDFTSNLGRQLKPGSDSINRLPQMLQGAPKEITDGGEDARPDLSDPTPQNMLKALGNERQLSPGLKNRAEDMLFTDEWLEYLDQAKRLQGPARKEFMDFLLRQFNRELDTLGPRSDAGGNALVAWSQGHLNKARKGIAPDSARPLRGGPKLLTNALMGPGRIA